MNRPIHIVDTFADSRYAGNPAAVAVCPEFPDAAVMQDAAYRIGVPTTAFVVPDAERRAVYGVRWFTPHAEINLCGHATIASTACLSGLPENAGAERLEFVSGNGVLFTQWAGGLVAIDLPADPPVPCDPPPELLAALGLDVGGGAGVGLGGGSGIGGIGGIGVVGCALSSDDVIVELESPEAVAAVRPDFEALGRLPFRGNVVTARDRSDSDVDFASRTFFPCYGVNEDQVCVTAHCKLGPYWARKLGRTRLTAVQCSERGGRLQVEDLGERVLVRGSAVLRPEPAAVEVGELFGAVR